MDLGKLGRSFRGLGKPGRYRLLRWGPMAVADLVAEWLRPKRCGGDRGAESLDAFAGPWSAGTSTGLLWQAAMDGHAISPSAFVRGGMGALSEALARAAKAPERNKNGDGCGTKRGNRGKGSLVVNTGEEISARAIVSNADPRTTF